MNDSPLRSMTSCSGQLRSICVSASRTSSLVATSSSPARTSTALFPDQSTLSASPPGGGMSVTRWMRSTVGFRDRAARRRLELDSDPVPRQTSRTMAGRERGHTRPDHEPTPGTCLELRWAGASSQGKLMSVRGDLSADHPIASLRPGAHPATPPILMGTPLDVGYQRERPGWQIMRAGCYPKTRDGRRATGSPDRRQDVYRMKSRAHIPDEIAGAPGCW